MAESLIDIRNRLALQGRRARLRAVPPVLAAADPAPAETTAAPGTAADGAVGTSPQIIFEHPETHRLMVASPVREAAAQDHPGLLRVSGRLVRAEEANANGAMWKQSDLEFGLPTVAHGPLNYQHGDTVLGALLSPRMVQAEAASDLGSYIHTEGILWRWLNQRVIQEVAGYLEAGQAWLSMECVAERVQCTGPNGCDAIMPYREAALKTDKACQHVRERSAHRRMVNPMFQGAAVIVPPKRPAWANADLVLRQADAAIEAASVDIPGLSDEEVAGMVATMISWAAR